MSCINYIKTGQFFFTISARPTMRATIPFITAMIATVLLLVSCNEDDKPTGPGPTAPDTTSHDFVWDITQIGVRHTSIDDVEAISDTDVWICGEIHFPDTYQNDSLGNIIKPFNLAHWNGREWSYLRLKWPSGGPSAFTAILAIKAFASNDIWFSTGGGMAHWDGTNFKYWEIAISTIPGFMPLLEGTPGNLYMAGSKGAMMHFDGEKHFTSIYSGTNQDINDMWTSNGVIMGVANNINDPARPLPTIFTIENGKITHWYDSLMYEGLSSLWFFNKNQLFITGPTLRRYDNGAWTAFTPPRITFFYCIRGQAMNDVFVAGDGGTIHHFNGKNWRYFPDYSNDDFFKLRRISYKDDHIWITGADSKAINHVIHGKRR